MGNDLVVQQKLTANFKTSLINPLWSQSNQQLIASMHCFVEACAALHDR